MNQTPKEKAEITAWYMKTLVLKWKHLGIEPTDREIDVALEGSAQVMADYEELVEV